jgi:hypothetical protein
VKRKIKFTRGWKLKKCKKMNLRGKRELINNCSPETDVICMKKIIDIGKFRTIGWCKIAANFSSIKIFPFMLFKHKCRNLNEDLVYIIKTLFIVQSTVDIRHPVSGPA